MKRWVRVIAMGIALCWGTALSQKPNILFLFSDDHTEQAIGSYGYWLKDIANTPNIDKLAGEGMRFEKCYVTNSICGPSRAVIQTGKHSHINGFRQNGNQFNGNQQTFPKIMRTNGYTTAVIGKWHLGTEPQGFDHYEVMQGQGMYNNPRFKTNTWNSFVDYQGYNSDIVVDRGIEWLTNTRDKSKPFMLMLQFKAAHRGWVPPAKYYRLYDTVNIPEHPTLLDDFDYRGSAAYHQDMSIRHSMNRTDVRIGQAGDPRNGDPEGLARNITTNQRNTWEAYENEVKADWAAAGHNWNNKGDDDRVKWMYRQYLRAYLGTGVALDDNIGRILKYVDDNNLRNNTVVIYSSDQGFYLGEHGWFDKRMMYEESLNTPLIVRWPGKVTPGTVNNDIVSNLDFAETFLDIGGITVPNDMQGRSLVPIFEGNTPADWRKSFYYQYWQGYNSTHRVMRHYGVTTGRYKLIYFHDVDEWEFYDLKRDPDEMINQYYIPENDSIINALKAELTRLRSQYNVPNEGNVATPPKITPMRWTTQLPVQGCNNPAYEEYDPEVDSLVPGACKKLVPIEKRINPDLNKLFQITHAGIKIEVEGNYVLSIYDVSGNLIQLIKGNKPGLIPMGIMNTPGVMLYQLESEKGTFHKRGLKI